MALRECLKAKEVAERLYGIAEGLERLDPSPSIRSVYAVPGRFGPPTQREAYLRRVLRDAIVHEAISLGALAERLGGFCDPAVA